MTDDVRPEMSDLRRSADAESIRLKDSQHALLVLFDYYRNLPVDRQIAAVELISDWLLSDDEALRFDALALVDEFGLKSTKPFLLVLAARLSASTAPGAKFELEKVHRLAEVAD